MTDSLFFALRCQIHSAYQTNRPIVAVTMSHDRWAEIKLDPEIRRSVACTHILDNVPFRWMGADFYVNRAGHPTVCWTDREALFDMKSGHNLEPAQ